MKKAWLFSLLLMWVFPVFGQAVEPGGADVRQRLQGLEWSLVATDWQSDGSVTADALAAIALNRSEMMFLRGRALEVLAILQSDVSDTVFSTLIQQKLEPTLRRRAVDGLCQAKTNLSLDSLLLPLLTEADSHLRVRAANCLVRLGADTERVGAALQAYANAAEAWELQAAGVTRRSE